MEQNRSCLQRTLNSILNGAEQNLSLQDPIQYPTWSRKDLVSREPCTLSSMSRIDLVFIEPYTVSYNLTQYISCLQIQNPTWSRIELVSRELYTVSYLEQNRACLQRTLYSNLHGAEQILSLENSIQYPTWSRIFLVSREPYKAS